MRSRHADLYNHDEDAPGYDRDVRRTDDPVRKGYDEVLDWVAAHARVTPDTTVVELGSGTGNLTLRIPPCRSLTCVDLSREMTRIARDKLAGRAEVSFVAADLLEYFDAAVAPFDVLVSTYAVHHLTGDEKTLLLERIAERLSPGGRIVIGDLMVEDAAAEAELVARHRAEGDDGTAEALEEEFFWNLEARLPDFADLGFTVVAQRFSTLSWGLRAERDLS